MQHWKTTLCGLAIAAITAVQTYNGHNGWQGYAGAALVAAFGFLTKDFDKA